MLVLHTDSQCWQSVAHVSVAWVLQVPLQAVDLSHVSILYTQGDMAAITPIYDYNFQASLPSDLFFNTPCSHAPLLCRLWRHHWRNAVMAWAHCVSVCLNLLHMSWKHQGQALPDQPLSKQVVFTKLAESSWRTLLFWIGPPGLVIASLSLLTLAEPRSSSANAVTSLMNALKPKPKPRIAAEDLVTATQYSRVRPSQLCMLPAYACLLTMRRSSRLCTLVTFLYAFLILCPV